MIPPRGGPSCPNHAEPLELTLADRTKKRGSSPCPISGELFDWEQNPQGAAVKKDKNGNLTHEFIVYGDDKQ